MAVHELWVTTTKTAAGVGGGGGLEERDKERKIAGAQSQVPNRRKLRSRKVE